MFYLIKDIDTQFSRALAPITPLLLLLTRLWVAWVFFNAGMLKFQSWDSTLYLFEYEYQVPLIPWRIAAYLGTATELIVPVFLALGLLTRPMALLLFIFNMIAVVSYPLLWEKGFFDHQLWGMMLLVNVFWGAGLISLDHLTGRARRPSRLME
ncbi:DoxX family protein [Photobacterium galatheae]|uniref:Membrane protein n=1 Tax=Photobacterium galatheae TaxID=1654360 RepID=A0A066RNV2_9GAMM|nr:DoxX family protein [Photobacterium galatheae]KDM92125.1 membrane protein [Photobacterium galatheae]MCM0150971.1 DoxX family protein [Photobacterium galatheae]